LKFVSDFSWFGLSSYRFNFTIYVPGSVSFDVGFILYYGNFPVIKLLASPKSISANILSSKSGSFVWGSKRFTVSPTVIYMSLILLEKPGGPLLGIIIVIGMINYAFYNYAKFKTGCGAIAVIKTWYSKILRLIRESKSTMINPPDLIVVYAVIKAGRVEPSSRVKV